ncbi:DUF4038 domain-containing protein [Lactobacillus acidophilus]|uniref:apiosidase-like domain-containing protein n=1 Tax=Lactobacillus acidophilus TaxID=1579 RepID=UPI001F0A6D51|nr:DUF4038 domain-containing protein [Lactobacillus acidophilus]MBN3489863.1 DUF4038 domain-containing protein [Lactobacillus acidophilus]
MLTTKDKYLYKDGKRFFYLADTCWGAFGSIDMPDWRYYLDSRKAAGFNTIQINVLRQWDSSLPIREPFAITNNEDGTCEYDFNKINESYFDNAVKMLEEMQKRDMVPALVLLWGNFVPNTWMSRFIKNNIMPFEQIKSYVTYVVNKFKRFNPIWIVSGDVGFTDMKGQKKDPAIKYYREVIKTAQEIDPEDLYTFHINGESTEVPDELFKKTDFFFYQSGHGYTGQSTAYTIPQKMRKDNYGGPIIDAELCYEGLTKMKAPTAERYSAFDVRRAAWRAVLSGADAGLGYGSFGIWPWKDNVRPEEKLDSNFNVQLVPYDWRDCLTFRGAKDVGFIKDFISEYASNGLNPINDPVKDNPEIRAAQNDKYIFIYLPTSGIINFDDLGIKVNECKIMDLDKRRIIQGKVENNVLQMSSVIEDELVIVGK